MARSNANPEKNIDVGGTTGPAWFWYAFLIIPFIVYLKGLAPGVVFGDSGDYLTAGWIQGVAHPPGYPLFTILTGIFEHLPIPPIWIQTEHYSTEAWRGNLLSMLFGLGTIACLFALVNRITQKPVIALAAAGTLTFSRVFWWHSEICENDTLSMFLLVGMLLLAVRWVQERRPCDPFILALAIGTGIAHHHVLIIFIFAIFIFLLSAKALSFNLKQWTAIAILIVVGLLPYIYLPAVNYKFPDRNLVFASEVGSIIPDADSGNSTEQTVYTSRSRAGYFFDYICRTIYGRQRQYTHTEEALAGDKTSTPDVFMFWTGLVNKDFGPIFSLIGLTGLFSGLFYLKRKRNDSDSNPYAVKINYWLLIFIGWIIYFMLIILYPSGDILRAPRYNLDTAGPGLMLPLEVLWSVFIGIGLVQLMKWLSSIPGNRTLRTYTFISIAILIVIINGVSNQPFADKSRNTIAHEYAVNVLNSCPDDGVLVVAGDEMYVFTYINNVHIDLSTGAHGYRNDVNLEPWAGMLGDMSELSNISGAMTSALVRLKDKYPDREINTTFFNSKFMEEPELQDFSFARRGLLFALVPHNQNGSLSEVNPALGDQTGIVLFEPELPDTYTWDFWGGNEITLSRPDRDLPDTEPRLWPPERECQWRTGEMLMFYGTNSLFSGDNRKAAAYFRQLVRLEPENPEAREYLGYATSPD